MLDQLIRWSKPARYGADNMLFSMSGRARDVGALKDRYKGRPLLVVGNGPSLNKTPLDEFAQVPSIGMNKIDMIFPRTIWRPHMIICINNLVVKQHAEHFAASDIPVYLSWKSRWFAPRSSSIKYFNLSLSEEFSTDASERIGSSVTVTYPALQLAYYLGADPVIIFGVDHNFDKVGKEGTYERRVGSDINHFDPNYFKAGSYWGLPNLEASEQAYARVQNKFESSGRRVFDATVNGKLEIFEKITVKQARELAGIATL